MIAQAYEDKKSTKKHPHADFLTEAVKDTSRKIEGKYLAPSKWEECSLKHVITSGNDWQFRFADTVKPKPLRVSPLSDDELIKVWKVWSSSYDVVVRAIANAAHNRAIEDVIKLVNDMSSVTTLATDELIAIYNEQDTGRVEMLSRVACKVIEAYARTLLKQLGE